MPDESVAQLIVIILWNSHVMISSGCVPSVFLCVTEPKKRLYGEDTELR